MRKEVRVTTEIVAHTSLVIGCTSSCVGRPVIVTALRTEALPVGLDSLRTHHAHVRADFASISRALSKAAGETCSPMSAKFHCAPSVISKTDPRLKEIP